MKSEHPAADAQLCTARSPLPQLWALVFGLGWRRLGPFPPKEGSELVCTTLSTALVSGQLEFSIAELAGFGIKDGIQADRCGPLPLPWGLLPIPARLALPLVGWQRWLHFPLDPSDLVTAAPLPLSERCL